MPTPTVDGKCFTDDIYKTVKKIAENDERNQCIFIIRSTVTPGFCKRLDEELGVNVVSNPEFLSEDTWEQDATQPMLVVLGACDSNIGGEVLALYKGRFKYIEPFVTDLTTAETIKYALNNFFSTKVIFANELYDFVRKVGANYETIRNVLTRHPWGSKNHFTVYYKGQRGIHGKCLPKDLESFANLTKSPLFKTLLEINERL
jgi:UDPglucose 6-dehydrogenase